MKKEERKKKKERQKDASKLLTEIISIPKKPSVERITPPSHWISTPVPEDISRHWRTDQNQQKEEAERLPEERQQPLEREKQQDRQQDQNGGWFAVGVNALEKVLATSPEEEEEEANERELSSWLPFSGGAPFGSEEPGDWNPFQTRQSPVIPASKSPAFEQSDYGHGGFFTPGIRGSTGNIQQKRVRGAVPGKAVQDKSSSIAQLTTKTAKRPKSGWDRSAAADESGAPSVSAAERRLRRGSLHGPVRPTDDRRRTRHARAAPDKSSSVIITHSSMQAVKEEDDDHGGFLPGAPIVPRESAERATNRSSSSLSSDDERAMDSMPRRKASPARRRPEIRRPGQRPSSAASSRASDPLDDDEDDDELSSWRVPSVVFRLLGEGGTSSSDETNPATDQLLNSIFGKDI